MSASAPLQSVTITRVESRALPTPHTVYALLVVLPVRSWTVFRRYSEFYSLHQALSEGTDGLSQPPAPFPPKHTARRTLKTITGLGGLLPQGESAKEADELQARERKDGLERFLRAIVASTDSSWRESEAFKDFIELPKSQTVASTSRSSTSPTASRYVPGSYSSPQHERQNARADQTNTVGGLTTRTLGKKLPAKETEATKSLDETGLIASQQAQMDAQDSQLEDLASVLRRQKAMGLAINHELLEQTELLDHLDQEVEHTHNKMTGAEKQLKRLGG
ncbi:hypothetical protein CBS101457_001445 [Exobasidium rhododendri]|nr:hypothetical protein CBS101457_001445 [Exobasidium rhododendri]